MSALSTLDVGALTPSFDDIQSRGEMIPAGSNMNITTTRGIVTAQRVAVPRNEAMILQKIKTNCAAFGTTYVYSWEVNDRRNNRKTTVEGGTIKLANMLARVYGNCHVGVEVQNTPTHTIFTAIFTDLETGYALERPFQQRRNQDIGRGYDADRAADMVFQIGVSKAIRNVVLNALPDLAAYAVEESKKALVGWLANDANKAKALTFIEGVMTEHGIDIKQVEAVVGRVQAQWTVQNLARVLMEMRGISDGLTVASEVYPTPEAAAEVTERKAQKDKLDEIATGKPAAKEKPTAKAKAEKAAPVAEPEPEHDPETGEIADAAPVQEAKPEPKPEPKPAAKAAPVEEDPEIPAFLRRDDPAPAAADDDDDTLFGSD